MEFSEAHFSELVKKLHADPGNRDYLEKIIAKFSSIKIISDMLNRIRSELPAHLTYHSPKHTDDVIEEVIRYAVMDNLPVRDIFLLVIGAAYHDAGFLKSYKDNEPLSAEMAKEAMIKEGGFSESEIKAVETIILDTSLISTESGYKQIANSNLSRYLLDADLSNFGRDDFFEKGELLRQELGFEEPLFLRRTYELIRGHSWYTKPAFDLREQKKQENLELMRKKVSQG